MGRRKPSVRKGVFRMEAVQTVPKGYQIIYVAWITLRNGKRLYAAAYGRKAWRLMVRK